MPLLWTGGPRWATTVSCFALQALPQVLPSLLERKMVFKGHMTREDTNSLAMTLLIQYPLPGGSALITFENPEGKSESSIAAPARQPTSDQCTASYSRGLHGYMQCMGYMEQCLFRLPSPEGPGPGVGALAYQLFT